MKTKIKKLLKTLLVFTAVFAIAGCIVPPLLVVALVCLGLVALAYIANLIFK